MSERIATFSFTSRLQSDVLRTQSLYSKTNLQISSGFISDDYMGIAPDTQIIVDVKSTIQRYDIQNQNAQRVKSRAQSMYAALGSLNSFANQFLTKIAQGIAGAFPNATDTEAAARGLRTNVMGALNTRVAGRYLFSGSLIDTLPVDITDPAYNNAQTSPSVVDTGYYQGDAVILSADIADNHSLIYGVTANQSGFEKFMRALNLVINNPSDINALSEAQILMQQSVDEMATVQADVAQKISAVETQILQNENDANYLDELLSGLTETDIAAATIRLTDYQTQLEASYSVMSMLRNMSLHDFL
ncbi:MAG: hypothetical protein V4621_02925 [Pseudomonadota bacterium]